jgi:ABC-type transport system substrate-binding protein
MALDRDRMRTAVFGDAAASARVSDVPVPGPVPPGAVSVSFDPAAARQLFEAAGAVGKPIPLFRGKAAVDKAMAAHIVKDAAAAGLTLEEKEVPSTGDVYRNRKHGGLLLMSTTGERDALPEKYWSLPQVDGKFDRKFRGDAFDDGVAALVEREERALYPERREQIRDLLFAAYSKKLPNIPLLFLADRIVAVADLDGWKEGSGANFGTTIERWAFTPPAAAATK